MRLLLGIILLFIALSGCTQNGGSGTIIPGGNGIIAPPEENLPDFAPLADEPGEPLPEGVECGSHVFPPVGFSAVGYSTPPQFFDTVENDFVIGCMDSNIETGLDTCSACGWPCAIETPYFYRFSNYDNEAGPAILTVHIWDLQCGDIGLEYRLPSQGSGEGEKVIAEFEPNI